MRVQLSNDKWVDLFDDPEQISNRRVRRVRLALAGISEDTFAKTAPRHHEGHETGEPCTEACESVIDALRRQGSLQPEQLEELWALNESVAVAAINESSWGGVTSESLQDLPEADYQTLLRETAPYYSKMLPDFSPTPPQDPETGEPVESPTEPSSA